MTPTDDLEIWRDRAAQHEIPKHWWNVPLLGFYKTLIYLFIEKKIPCAFCCTTCIRRSVFFRLFDYLFICDSQEWHYLCSPIGNCVA